MSLLGNDMNGTATINGLNNVNANQVYGDELYYDASTTPVNVKLAIAGITIDVTALQSDVLVLQGEMNTAQSDISTLQSEMNTAQSDINDLQSDMNTAQADITALYVTTGANTAAIAGLSVSQAAQDVTIAAQGVSIGVLQGEMTVVESDITALQVKTTNQSWASLTGTTFSGRLNIGTTGAGIVLNTASTSTFGSALTVGTGSGVTLNTATASTFGSGVNSTRLEALAATSALQVGDNQTSGFMNIGCNTNRTGGGINIGGGNANASPTYINAFTSNNALVQIGSSTATGQVVSIRGTNVTVGSTNTTTLAFVAAPSSNVFFSRNATGGALVFGNDGASGSNNLDFNVGAGNAGAIRFGTGAAAKTITFGTTAATLALNGTTTISGITNINTTTLSNTTIGNGPAGGNITLNGAINAITGTTNINSTGTYGTTIGNTTGTVTINSGILDINANNGITIDGGSTATITSINDMTLQTTNPFGDILVSSAGTNTLTSVGQTQINSSTLDVNASGAITIDGTSTTTVTSASTLDLIATTNNANLTTSSATGDINLTSGRNINLIVNTTGSIINATSNKDQDILKINNTAFDSKFLIGSATTGFRQTVNNNSYANLTALGNSELNLSTANAIMSLVSTGGSVNINTTGVESTIIGNLTGILTIRGGTTNINGSGSSGNTNIGNATGTLTVTGIANFNDGATIVGATYINNTGTASTNIGNVSGMLTITGDTDINGETSILGIANINISGTAATNIGVASATAGDVTIRGQNMTFESYDSISMEATNGFWTNIGADNFYYRSYNGVPTIIMGNQTTATDYFSLQATSTGTTLDSLTQPMTLTASQVNINNAVMDNAALSNADIEIDTPIAVDSGYTTYPITTANKIGRFSSTTGTTEFTTVAANILSLAIPSAGTYICEGQFYFSGASFTTQVYTTISLSTTSATVDNTRQNTSYQGGTGGNYANHITSVLHFTGASTLYLVGLAQQALGAAPTQSNYLSATRIA